MIKANQLPQFDLTGIIRCGRYAFMPNRLTFCGPDKNKDLLAYVQAKTADQGMIQILEEFQTLYPYLKMIARHNQIKDPFSEKVVEAYWIGNSLLDNITKGELYRHLVDKSEIKKKLSQPIVSRIKQKIDLGAKAHHNFHVLSVWKQGDNLDSIQTLNAMDLCRISWGQVKKARKTSLDVEYEPLVFDGRELGLGQPAIQKVNYKIQDQGFIKRPKIGDWISTHWGFACEVLTNQQIASLKKYTQESIDLANAKG